MELLPAPHPAPARLAGFDRPVARHRLPSWPWLMGDVLGLAVANLVGLGLLLSGLYGARHTTDPERSLLLLTIAAAGLVVSFAGNTVFLLTGLRQVGRFRDELLGRRTPRAVPTQPAPVVADQAGALVATARMTRFHRPGCLAVAGKPVVESALADHEAAGRRPCGMCVPLTKDLA